MPLAMATRVVGRTPNSNNNNIPTRPVVFRRAFQSTTRLKYPNNLSAAAEF